MQELLEETTKSGCSAIHCLLIDEVQEEALKKRSGLQGGDQDPQRNELEAGAFPDLTQQSAQLHF